MLQRTELDIALFDQNVRDARAVWSTMSDADYAAPWTMLMGGKAVFTMPHIAMVRTWVMNHLIHHRGQYSVYLRLQGIPIPGMYGPSADEPGGM